MADRPSAADDAVLTRIAQVVMLHRGGDREEARSRFLRLWAEIGEDGDPLHRCTLAHFMAGTQDDPLDELTWDLRALAAAEELAGERPATGCPATGNPAPEGGPAADEDRAGDDPADGRLAGRAGGQAVARALYPALHLSLAVDYAKLGRTAAAHVHLRRVRHAAGALHPRDGGRRAASPSGAGRRDRGPGKDGAGGTRR